MALRARGDGIKPSTDLGLRQGVTETIQWKDRSGSLTKRFLNPR